MTTTPKEEPRYFELSVMEGGFVKRRRYSDIELRAVRIPLGELLEREIEDLRRSCVLAQHPGKVICPGCRRLILKEDVEERGLCAVCNGAEEGNQQ